MLVVGFPVVLGILLFLFRAWTWSAHDATIYRAEQVEAGRMAAANLPWQRAVKVGGSECSQSLDVGDDDDR
jgi:hypothetical protein